MTRMPYLDTERQKAEIRRQDIQVDRGGNANHTVGVYDRAAQGGISAEDASNRFATTHFYPIESTPVLPGVKDSVPSRATMFV
jgi:hypothetical protein